MASGQAQDVSGTLTRLIGRIDAGEQAAYEQFCELVYGQLRVIARHRRRQMNVDSLVTTEVVQELFRRFLANGRLGQMKNRRYFYAAAADQMRRLLIDHLRHKQAESQGGKVKRVALDPWLDELTESAAARCGGDLEALDRALQRLRLERPRQHEIVQLRFFAGLTNQQIAEALGVSVDTVKRDWKVARARLGSQLSVDA
ncbi:MAG: sigma-70 family RNA polymerase sigma factor [Pirellulales bacterium]|nr:sigma-70 family RNA polymerase sigma factor [Pirellulales bacterium]